MSSYVTRLLDPDLWTPDSTGLRRFQRPTVGDLVGWRYAAWRVTRVDVVAEYDLLADDIAALKTWKPQYRELKHPYRMWITHERGPVLIDPPDLSLKLGFRVNSTHLPIVDEPYRTCSCHSHPWPCQDVNQQRATELESAKADRLLTGAQSGVCAACLGPISTRQRVVVFPEPSLLVPGAPGPTYHAGRAECWAEAVRYEVQQRLPAYPTADRLVSCPGVLFVHGDDRRECTAGPGCTNLHGSSSRRRGWRPCYSRGLDGAAPLTTCEHRGCIGRAA